MAGLSRPKDGVLSHAYVPAIHVFLDATLKDVDARDKRGHDRGEAMPHVTHAARWGTQLIRSFPRKRESRLCEKSWVPAFAGTSGRGVCF